MWLLVHHIMSQPESMVIPTVLIHVCVLALIFLLVQSYSMYSTVTFSQMISCLFVWLYMYCYAIVLVLILDRSFRLCSMILCLSILSVSPMSTHPHSHGMEYTTPLSLFFCLGVFTDNSLLKVWLVHNTTWKRT